MAAALAIGLILSLLLFKQTEALLVQVNAVTSDKDRTDLTRSALQYQADNLAKIWTTVVQGIGAIVLALGAVATWRNLQVAQENARVGQDTLRVTQDRPDVDRQAQITNRFTQAIGQLGAELNDGKPNLEVRLGGIYALERIAKDSPRDHWTIMEILTAYVRQNARWINPFPSVGVVSSPEDVPLEQPHEIEEPPEPRTDIQAILTVLGRRIQSQDPLGPVHLDLSRTDLRRVTLAGAHLEQANLMATHLEKAILVGAHLEKANLMGAYCRRVIPMDADLDGAILVLADLEEAISLTRDQVYAAISHGEGALLPHDWPTDWRDRFNGQGEQPPPGGST